MKKIVIAVLIGLIIPGSLYYYYTMNKIKKGVVIILNGPSSSGKSSIIKAFQKIQTDPWLGIGIDNFFVGVIPQKFYMEDKPEHYRVMRGIFQNKNNKKVFTLNIGEYGQQVIKGMHRSIAAYAHSGCNVIVDYIMYNSCWLHDLQSSLKKLKVFNVKVSAPLSVIEQREKERGTSPQGHARSHYKSVHEGWNYHLKVNTFEKSPEQIARLILDKAL